MEVGLVPRWTCISDSRGAPGPLIWGVFPWVGTKGTCFEWSSFIILCPCLPFPPSLPSFIFPVDLQLCLSDTSAHSTSSLSICESPFSDFIFPITQPLSLFSFLGPTVVWLMLVLKTSVCPYKIRRVTLMCHCALTLILLLHLSITTTFHFNLFYFWGLVLFLFFPYMSTPSLFIYLI